MEEGEGKDLEVKSSGVIDVSCENDSLLISDSSTSTVSDDALIHRDHHSLGLRNEARSCDLFGDVDADKPVDMAHTSEQTEQLSQLLETSEPLRPTKAAKCNLRKSLAWDSAFFTSAGVLDAEELSSMIEEGGKGVKHRLPGIEEDVHRSIDSISTLESDNLTLESLEAELFEDIRASIQKSSKASNLAASSSKDTSGKMETQAKASNSSKKAALASGHRSALRIRDSTSSIPQPSKVISRANPISTVTSKRASLSANHVKTDNDIAKCTPVSRKGTQVSKVTELGGPRRAVPKPAISSKSSSLGSSTGTKTETTRSSSCSSSGNFSDIGKPATLARRKVDSKVGKSTSSSIPKTPSRIVPKNKTLPVNSRLSAHLISANLSSSISPASSISEWSSESSSSTSTVNRRSFSRVSLDTSSSHISSSSDVTAHSGLTDQISDRNANQIAALPSQNIKNTSTQTGSLSRPPSFQPSGLRMPSPKIGFFDGAKSVVRTPNGGIVQSQSRLPTGLPKIGAGCSSSIGSSNKTKVGKRLPAKTKTPTTNPKPNTPKSASPKSSQELSNTKANISSSSRGVKDCPVLSPELQSEKSGMSCLKTKPEEKDGNPVCSKLEICISMPGSADLPEIKIAPSCSNICIDSPHGVGKNAISEQHCVVIKPPDKTIAKENGQFHDQIDGLPTNVGIVDWQLEPKKLEKPLDNLVTDSSRIPLAVKNSLCNTEGCNISIGSGIEVVQNTTNLPYLEMAQIKNI